MTVHDITWQRERRLREERRAWSTGASERLRGSKNPMGAVMPVRVCASACTATPVF